MVSGELIEFVKAWEGLKLVPSGDPLVSGVVDVGYGHVLRAGEPRVRITKAEAEALLYVDLQIVDDGVSRLVKVRARQSEQDALCSFVYNLGLGALSRSTLLRLYNAGDEWGAALQFPRWCMAGGKIVRGLQKRRVAEQGMLLRGDYSGRP